MKAMKFTKEELHEMRKLAGIDYSVVDYVRTQDMLNEAINAKPITEAPTIVMAADVKAAVEAQNAPDAKPEGWETVESLPAHHMPSKTGHMWKSHSASKSVKLVSLMKKHKHPAVAGAK